MTPAEPSAPALLLPPSRAESHGVSAHLGVLAWAALCAIATWACGPGSSSAAAPEGSSAGPADRIQTLVEAYRPVPPGSTSDKHDAALQNRRALLEELRGGDRELGLAAWAAFRANEHERDELRSALLEVAAVCDPPDLAPVLEHMVVTYDSALGLGLRTRAAELLAETAPERALEVIAPLLTEKDVNITLPPREVMVRAWASAARAVKRQDLGVLIDVAVDIRQPADTRYAAIAELGVFGGSTARQALEEVLFEPTSDAYLRRKAAQSLEAFLAPAELCPILERAGSHEHDEIFAQFLASMMAKHCP
jgi:hypothetical protein